MTRMQFGGGPEDVYLVPDGDGDMRQAGGVVIRMWSTETGISPVVDLLDMSNNPITYVTTSTGSDGRAPGQIAPFQGPDAVYELWAGPDDQPRFLLQASNLGSVLGDAREQLLSHISEVNGHSTRVQDLLDVNGTAVEAATDGQVLTYDTGTGQWTAEDPASTAGALVSDILWVAASNAPAAFDAAPYQCDGTADEVQINQALDNVLGLRVGLSPGTFTLAAPIQMLGANDTAVEVSRYLHGSGTYATKLVVASGVSSGIVLGNVVCPHISDLNMTIVSTSNGIYSTKSAGGSAGSRSFWHGSIKNVIIRGPNDGSHSGWAMKLGSGYSYVVENLDISGVGNGVQLLAESNTVECGDIVFNRCFVKVIGTNAVAWYTTANPSGNVNRLTMISCHASVATASTGTVGWKFELTNAARLINCNLDQFVTGVSIANTCYDVEVNLSRGNMKNGSTLFDLDGYGCRVSCGIAASENGATVTLIDDDNTFGVKPNVAGPISLFADTGSTINADIIDTVVLRDILFDGAGTIAPALRRPPGTLQRKTYTLTDAATITMDATQGDDFRVTLGGNRTLAAPTGPTDGQHITILVIQDGTGSRTLTWNSVFTFGTITNALTTTASRRDLFEFVYNSTLVKWLVLNASKNLT